MLSWLQRRVWGAGGGPTASFSAENARVVTFDRNSQKPPVTVFLSAIVSVVKEGPQRKAIHVADAENPGRSSIFSVCDALGIAHSTAVDSPDSEGKIFSWAASANEPSRLYVVVFDTTSDADKFADEVGIAVYEAEYDEPWSPSNDYGLTLQDLLHTARELPFELETLTIRGPRVPATPALGVRAPAADSPSAGASPKQEAEIIITVDDVELLEYDPDQDGFTKTGRTGSFDIVRIRDLRYAIQVRNGSERCFGPQVVSQDMFPQWNLSDKLLMWRCEQGTLGSRFGYQAVVFPTTDDATKVSDAFSRCLHEAVLGEKYDEEKANSGLDSAFVKSLARTFNDVATNDGDTEMEDYYDDIRSPEEEGSDASDEEDYEEDDSGKRTRPDADMDPDRMERIRMTDSSKFGRTFMSNGDGSLSVYKRDEQGNMSYLATVDIKTPSKLLGSTSKDEIFSPAAMELHNGDTRLLMCHSDQAPNSAMRGKVMEMDLSRGEIVSMWNAGEQCPVDKVIQSTRYASETDTSVIVGMNERTLFGMDSRLSNNGPKGQIIGDLGKLQYAKNPNFSCAATTSEGHLAAGSETGEIRLYTGTPGMAKSIGRGDHAKLAKTLLPGVGAPITAVDVSADARWVLATTPTFVMVIDTQLDDGGTSNGFAKRMGKYKNDPIILKLRPADEMKVGGNIYLSPARFNTGRDDALYIVSSSGQFIICWNFRSIQRGNLYDYTMKKEEKPIVLDQFTAGQHDQSGAHSSILVALPDRVKLERRYKSNTPSKEEMLRRRRGY